MEEAPWHLSSRKLQYVPFFFFFNRFSHAIDSSFSSAHETSRFSFATRTMRWAPLIDLGHAVLFRLLGQISRL